MERRRVVVSGTVQGVFFRVSCQREAAARGVAGWVSNRPDGAVEAVFEGDADAVAALVEWCRHGPPHAEVESVDVTVEAVEGSVVLRRALTSRAEALPEAAGLREDLLRRRMPAARAKDCPCPPHSSPSTRP